MRQYPPPPQPIPRTLRCTQNTHDNRTRPARSSAIAERVIPHSPSTNHVIQHLEQPITPTNPATEIA